MEVNKNATESTGVEETRDSNIARMMTGSVLRWAGTSLVICLVVVALSLVIYPRDHLVYIAGALLKWAPLMFSGFLFNILVSVLSMAIGTTVGAAIGLGQLSRLRLVSAFCWLATQFFRNAPWLVLLFYCIFLIPFSINAFGTNIPLAPWIKATIGLSLPVMGNVSEVVRGAIESVPTGQWEAAKSLSLSRNQAIWLVILPQCMKRMLPPWMNIYAILTMATPIMSIVGVDEAMTITRAALSAEGRSELLLPMYLMLMSWFFIYCYPIARLTVILEERFRLR
jgi:polar amino acid transport system permease protein